MSELDKLIDEMELQAKSLHAGPLVSQSLAALEAVRDELAETFPSTVRLQPMINAAIRDAT